MGVLSHVPEKARSSPPPARLWTLVPHSSAQLAQGTDSLLTRPASFPDLTGNSRRSADLAESAPGMLCGHPASRKLPGGQCVHVSTACLPGSPGPVVANGEAAARQRRHSLSGRAGGRQPWRGGEADGTHRTANLSSCGELPLKE